MKKKKTKKVAISYYFDIFRYGNAMINVEFHDSGKDAITFLKKEAKYKFENPTIYKGKQELPKKGQYSIGFAFRGLVARYLTKSEIKLLEKYGEDEIWLDFENKKLCAPEKTKKGVIK